MQIKTIGIDLGKTACDVAAMEGRGKVVSRRRLSRARLVAWLANLPPARIGLEASCGAHHLARRLAALGHEVKLMPAPYVRPFVKTNKHDQADPRVRLCRPEGRQAIAARRSAPTSGGRRWEPGAGAAAADAFPRVPDWAQSCGR